MKLLIFTAATGGGHLRAAHAVETWLRDHGGAEVVTVDALKAVGGWFDRIICGSYLFMARRTPALFGRLYRQSNKRNPFGKLVAGLTRLFSRGLLQTLEQEQPDVILSTHPFAASMTAALKEKGLVKAPLISLITDYGAHLAYLADNGAEAYVVACEDMVEELAALGIPREKVYPFGIPVHEQFFLRPDRAELRRELGLDPELPTVLFMAGSFGVSNIMGLFRDLDAAGRKMQAVVITGRNRRLYDAFQKEISAAKNLPTQLVFFTDQVEKYMRAADLLVTKPGGLTVSEALAEELPLAAFDAIPGQEEDNAAFLARHGMGIRLRPGGDFAGEIGALLDEPARLSAMRSACADFDKSRCVPDILSLCGRLTGD